MLVLVAPSVLNAESLKLVDVAAGGEALFAANFSLDSGRAFLSADDDGDEILDFFSVSLAGGPPTLLNEPFSDPFTVAFPIALAPDGSTVVYGLDGLAGERLYSVPAVGPAAASVRLDLEVAWDLDISRTFISGDGQRVIFEGNQQDEDIYELFSAPLQGPAGATIKLNGLLLSSSISQPVLSRDGLRVIYAADQDAGETGRELYSVPVDGSTEAVRLSGGGNPGTGPVATETHVVFFLGGSIFSVPIDGPASAAVLISVTPEPGGFVRSSLYQVTPDGQTVVYRVNNPDNERIYAVPIDGPPGANVQLTPDDEDVIEFQLAGNSRVVYDQRREPGGRELFSVPITGPSSAAVRLNQDVVPDNGGSSTYQISPDGSRVVFQATLDVPSKSELWSVPIAGPASAGFKLSPPLPDEADVFFDFVISPDSQRVAYRVDLDVNNAFDLYSVGIAGPTGSGVKLNGPLASGGDVCATNANCYRFAPDSNRVIYSAQEEAGQLEFFIADDGRAAPAFTEPSRTVFEGTTEVLTIDMGAAAVLPVTAQVTQTGGTATAEDFSLAPGLQIAPGQTTAEVSVTLVSDLDQDAGETLELSITNVQNAGQGLPFTTVLTIRPEGEIFSDGFE